jgi:Gpi18-like mannosyltransferase
LLHSWYRWDTGQYISIATSGYQQHWKFAFFPPGRAYRTALYLSVFPTAFFFATAYNESLFLILILLSFYYLRHANWWLAGLCGLFATLTRSGGLILLLPFCYEYAYQHRFKLKSMRFDCIAGALIPAGLGFYSLYCYVQVQDALAFSHAEAHRNRELQAPWQSFRDAFRIIQHQNMLTFFSIHNVLDLSARLFIRILLVLCFVGPWKFSREHLAYGLYAAGIFM